MLQSRKVLVIAFMLLSFSGAGLAQSVAKIACGFSIKLPAHWTMSRTPNRDVKCWYALESPKKDSCRILVRTLDSDFASAALEAGLTRSEDRWVYKEPWFGGETLESDPLTGKGWQGVQANYIERDTDPGTGNTTGAEMSVAVLSTGKARSAIIQGAECQPRAVQCRRAVVPVHPTKMTKWRGQSPI